MTRYSKLNFVYRLQKWMDSVPGQTFLNYTYSWGASLVILGALFKLTHLPGASLMLYIGMGTEVFVFFISAFDRPFDKTAIGMELPTHLDDDDEHADGEALAADDDAATGVQRAGQPATIIIGGSGVVDGSHGGTEPGDALIGQPYDDRVAAAAGQVGVVPQPVVPDMAEAAGAYVEELKKLTEVLQKVSEQSQRLTTDSEEMENLNRTLTGICKIYEMQLKSASSQIGTIDEINAQTRKMADQIEQLNTIYTRMIEAMTVNMRAAGAATQQ
ncbi:MAG: gliding motility protein GldL [Prevotella sp.]|uniref:type IX secretion system motor protein PorL/GldL n=1 Tax=Prevotella sp. TaxID=59823 RepID=UPI002A251FEA|nr:gliding motility protein GldL [Prevotella sp.]MDD7317944.1 gliding motility protein GldL [Prevotellaceae bacterium]MDY4020835.1 gliding motility protein GldL [Prevotella sp.]